MSGARTTSFIGAGNIGGPIALRLLGAGHPLTVVDPDDERAAAVVAAGGTRVPLPRDAARADLVFLSLPSPVELRDVIAGPGGLLETLGPGTVVVDLGTGDPATTRELAAAVQRRGAGFLDAPVTRGVEAARRGELALLVGGDEQLLSGVRDVLAAIASDVFPVGDVGSGQVVKLCNNLLVNAHLAAAAEVLATGVELGVPLETLIEVLPQSSASSFVLDRYLPRILADDLQTTFALDLAAKDIRLYLDAASATEVDRPVATAVADVFSRAQDHGLGPRDFVAVTALYGLIADGTAPPGPGDGAPAGAGPS